MGDPVHAGSPVPRPALTLLLSYASDRAPAGMLTNSSRQCYNQSQESNGQVEVAKPSPS